LGMPATVLLPISETLCSAANTPDSYRELARRLLGAISGADLRPEELARVGRAMVDARDGQGLLQLVARQSRQHPEWEGTQEIERLRNDAALLIARTPTVN